MKPHFKRKKWAQMIFFWVARGGIILLHLVFNNKTKIIEKERPLLYQNDKNHFSGDPLWEYKIQIFKYRQIEKCIWVCVQTTRTRYGGNIFGLHSSPCRRFYYKLAIKWFGFWWSPPSSLSTWFVHGPLCRSWAFWHAYCHAYANRHNEI